MDWALALPKSLETFPCLCAVPFRTHSPFQSPLSVYPTAQIALCSESTGPCWEKGRHLVCGPRDCPADSLLSIVPLLLREGKGLSVTVFISLTVTMTSVMCSGCSPEAFLGEQMNSMLVSGEEETLLLASKHILISKSSFHDYLRKPRKGFSYLRHPVCGLSEQRVFGNARGKLKIAVAETEEVGIIWILA